MHRQAQAVHDVTAGVLLPRGALGRVRADDASGHLVEGGTRRRPADVDDVLRRPAEEGAHEEGGEDLGGGLGLDRIVGFARAQARGRDDLADFAVLEASDDDERQAHDRAVAGAGRALRGAGNALFALEGEQRSAHLATNVETHVRRRTVPFLEPAHVSLHHVEGVVTTHRQQRIRQAQRHRRVVRPLAGLELEGAPSDHARGRREGAYHLELVRRAQRVTDRQAHQRAARARKKSRHAPSVPQGPHAGAAPGADCQAVPVNSGAG